jgi:hypothetical protein
MDFKIDVLDNCYRLLRSIIRDKSKIQLSGLIAIQDRIMECFDKIITDMEVLLPEEKMLLRQVLPIETLVLVDYRDVGGDLLRTPFMTFKRGEYDFTKTDGTIARYKLLKVAVYGIVLVYAITLARWINSRTEYMTSKIWMRLNDFERIDQYIISLKTANTSTKVEKLIGKRVMDGALGDLFVKFNDIMME